VLVGAVALVGLTAAAGTVLMPSHLRATALTLVTRGPSTLAPHRVVVAPLENRTGDPALATFGEMAADWTTQALARTAEFEVVDARTAAVTARVVDRIPRLLRADDRAIALAQETGAGTVIAGRYYRDGDTVRVHVQLTDVESRRVRRSLGPLNGDVRALSRLVDDVSRRAAALLVAAVDTSAAGLGVGQAPPPSYEAYRETSRAWERYYVSDFRGAFAHAHRAVSLDTTYMLPLVIQAFFHSEQREWAAADSLLARVARRGVAPSRLEQAGFDMVRGELTGDVATQLRGAQELARLAPGSVEAHAHVAHVAVTAGRPHAALAALAPLDPRRGVLLVVPFYWNWRLTALHALGRHAEELAVTRDARRQFPTRNVVLLNAVRAFAAAGRADEARDLARGAVTERWDAAAVRRRALVEGSRELRAHGYAAAAPRLLHEALAEYGARDDALATPQLEARALLLVEAERWPEAGAALRAESRA
jgi:TolB-like protein